MIALPDTSKQRIAAALGPAVADRLARFLHSGKSELTETRPVLESAREALLLWSVRAANAASTNVQIDGIDDLVKNLANLDPGAELEHYTHQSGRAVLMLYREALGKRPLGYLCVNTPKPENEGLLERLGIVLPKSIQAEPAAKRTA